MHTTRTPPPPPPLHTPRARARTHTPCELVGGVFGAILEEHTVGIEGPEHIAIGIEGPEHIAIGIVAGIVAPTCCTC